MLQKSFEQGEKNKIVPAWFRALVVITCLLGAIWLNDRAGKCLRLPGSNAGLVV